MGLPSMPIHVGPQHMAGSTAHGVGGIAGMQSRLALPVVAPYAPLQLPGAQQATPQLRNSAGGGDQSQALELPPSILRLPVDPTLVTGADSLPAASSAWCSSLAAFPPPSQQQPLHATSNQVCSACLSMCLECITGMCCVPAYLCFWCLTRHRHIAYISQAAMGLTAASTRSTSPCLMQMQPASNQGSYDEEKLGEAAGCAAGHNQAAALQGTGNGSDAASRLRGQLMTASSHNLLLTSSQTPILDSAAAGSQQCSGPSMFEGAFGWSRTRLSLSTHHVHVLRSGHKTAPKFNSMPLSLRSPSLYPLPCSWIVAGR
jgi:hypothetical protein